MAIAYLDRWVSPALDLVFPPRCAWCHVPLAGSRSGMLCPPCRVVLVSLQPYCPRCAAPLPIRPADTACIECQARRFHFSSVTRLGRYEGPLRAAVLKLKDARQRGLALALADLLVDARGERLREWQVDAVVPVPMHWSRRLWRGGNSPSTIATRLASRLEVPLADHLLARRRRTVPQASLSPRRRRANVRGAFRAARHRNLPGARLLLVDDIMTTGATVDEAAKILLQAGAAFVGVAVVARATGEI